MTGDLAIAHGIREITAKGGGKVRLRSIESCRKRVKDGEPYLLRRHGAWFRPKAEGYTTEIAAAGIFDAAARSYLDAEGLSAVPLKAMAPAILAELLRSKERTVLLENLLSRIH